MVKFPFVDPFAECLMAMDSSGVQVIWLQPIVSQDNTIVLSAQMADSHSRRANSSISEPYHFIRKPTIGLTLYRIPLECNLQNDALVVCRPIMHDTWSLQSFQTPPELFITIVILRVICFCFLCHEVEMLKILWWWKIENRFPYRMLQIRNAWSMCYFMEICVF